MTNSLEGLSDDDPAPPELLPRTPKRHTSCSKAGYRFQLQHARIFDFFWFALTLSMRADKVRFTAAEALAGLSDPEPNHVADFEMVQKNPRATFSKLSSFSDYQSELMIIGW